MLSNNAVIPQLNTTTTAPLDLLEQQILSLRKPIAEWFEAQWRLTKPPIYGSVDLRNAGFKIAPIDMNLFPAGFNNLNPNFMANSILAAQQIIHSTLPNAKNILLIPEAHTRNLFYWENVYTLQQILLNAGFNVRLGWLNGAADFPSTIHLNNGTSIQVDKLIRENNKLTVENFTADFILLNNDLSEGIPPILQNLNQPIIPPAELGWSQRLKSDHFHYYAQVASEFAQAFNLDAWLIAPLFRHCGHIDFMQQDGMDCLIDHAEKLFAEISQKYAHYQIPYQPFLIVKADAGTYGMAVMTVRNVEELTSLNRKQRTRMSKIKGGQPVNRVIIQEGVYTFETIGPDKAVAEPVVYLMGCSVIGGFYRVHKERAIDENLNSPGMEFQPIAFAKPCNEPCPKAPPDPCQNRLYTYGIIAQLSMLAAAREMKDQSK